MHILDKKKEKRLSRRIFWIRLAIGVSRIVRSRLVTRFLNWATYFGSVKESGLEFIAPYHTNLLIRLRVHSWVERKIISTGYYEREMDHFFTRSLREGMVAIDVGANIGCHTLVMASAVGSSGKVVAFEPFPKMAKRLKENILLNRLENIVIREECLGEAKGELELFVPSNSEYNQAVASLHQENLPEGSESIKAQITTLDAVRDDLALERVDLIKVDVEGHEYQVFKGAEKTIEKFQPSIIFEFSERQWKNAGYDARVVESWLSERGYELHVMRRNMIISVEHGVSERCNILALPRTRT